MYSPPPDEAAEALARDPIDPVEATERFLEDAAADADPPGKDEILCVRCVECQSAAPPPARRGSRSQSSNSES